MAAKKSIRLIILRADRNEWDGGAVRLRVTSLRKGLKVLHDSTIGPQKSNVDIELDLMFDAGQVYGVVINVPNHRAGWTLVNHETFIRKEGDEEVELNNAILRLMLVPDDPHSSDLNDGWDRLRKEESMMSDSLNGIDEQTFNALSPESKMALLNIEAKLKATRVNSVPMLSYVESLRLVQPARLYLYVRSEMKGIVDKSADFGSAPGHGSPSEVPFTLPAHPDSWKHKRFGAGNLQLSFAKTPEIHAEKEVYSVDADIDLGRDLDHVGEWLDNEVLHPGKKTDQTLVYALLFSQGIIPLYALDPI